MVTGEGRVVLLDFGLARDLVSRAGERREHRGTPGYMAPEQAAGRGAGPASDWYALGAMTFEVLAGRLPFIGNLLSVLHAKVRSDPPDPAQYAPDAPADLLELCASLLRRDPAQRPTGAALLKRLGASVAPPPPAAASDADAILLGRGPQLGTLRRALADVHGGRAAAVLVSGNSGMGKSALLARFLEQSRAQGALVLEGRCYEQESVPYKAFDALIDALSDDLSRRSEAELAMILPRDPLGLGRLFPVLQRVRPIAAASPLTATSDQAELRRQGFGALRELFYRLAQRAPLILVIEDLQWADVDGLRLLVALITPPEAPPMLTVGSYRTDAVERSKVLGELGRLRDQGAFGDVREVEVGPLAPAEAYELAAALLGGGPGAEARARRIAQESAGSPFFVGELARHADTADGRAPTLEAVVRARVAALPFPVRRVLDVIALAGRPLPRRIILDAAQVPDGAGALGVLRAQCLVRTSGLRGDDFVGCYHDRIREVVVAHLDGVAKPAAHTALARALEASANADPELVAWHLVGAGHKARAAWYARIAADRAASAFAFDRAAGLYFLAYQLGRPQGDDKRDLRRRLAAALVNAGRGAEASRAFLALAKGADGSEALELRRRAAEQLLISGHLDEGMQILRGVLTDVGAEVPASPARALAAFLARAAQLRLRGFEFKEQAIADVAHADIARIDACFSAASGLTFSDPIRGAYFQALHLGLALKAGEPSRIALGLANYGAHVSSEGLPTKERAAAIIGRARQIAEAIGMPRALGRARMAEGTSAFFQGRFREALAALDETERILRERCVGVAWELDGTGLWSRLALFFLGDLPELRRRESIHRQDAEARSDLFVETWLGASSSAMLHLVDGAPNKARAAIANALTRWTGAEFNPLHFLAMWHRTMVELYVGDGAIALESIASQWPAVEKALLLRIQVCAVVLHHARGAAALAAARAAGKSERGKLVALAERDAKAIEKQGVDYGAPLAGILRAGATALRGDNEGAARLAEGAAKQFEACGMRLHAILASRRAGEFRGDPVALVAAADALRALSVQDPASLSRIL